MIQNSHNILAIKQNLFFVLLFVPLMCTAQYRWGISNNFEQLNGDTAYKYAYKIKADFKQTWYYYKMSERTQNNIITLRIVDFDGNPRPYEPVTLTIDTKDTLLITDTNGNVKLMCNQDIQTICINSFFVKSKVFMPITEESIPSQMTLVAGTIGKRCYLNIFCRRPLDFEEIKTIKGLVLNGETIENDDFYYYFSDL